MLKAPFIQIKNLSKHYPIQRGFWSRIVGYIQALNNVSLNISKREIIGIVGESGSGKSTLGKLILKLLEPTSGEVLYNGENIFTIPNNKLRLLRQKLQIVFQNPYSSLNPRMKIKAIVSEPIIVHKLLKTTDEINNRTLELLNSVGLENQLQDKYPHELSGGQRQRAAIARALSLSPEFLVLDEPVSALDVSVQAQIINLLVDLHKKLELTYLFISHNLSVVSYLATQIAVMYLGHIVEIGTKENVLNNPQHPYTVALLSTAPKIERRELENQSESLSENDKLERADVRQTRSTLESRCEAQRHCSIGDKRNKKIILKGEIPDPASPPSGCVFRTRCPIVKDKCATEIPLLQQHNNQLASCHFAGELSRS